MAFDAAWPSSRKHLVLDGAAADVLSPYATTAATSYTPHQASGPRETPFGDYMSGWHHNNVQSGHGSEALASTTEYHLYGKQASMTRVPTAPSHISRGKVSPVFCDAASRVMPPGTSAERFAKPQPAPIARPRTGTGKGATNECNHRAGGFNKANMGPCVARDVAPPPAGSATPPLTTPQQRGLEHDSASRLHLTRDFYDRPYLTSSSFYTTDMLEHAAGADKASPAPATQQEPATQWSIEERPPAWHMKPTGAAAQPPRSASAFSLKYLSAQLPSGFVLAQPAPRPLAAASPHVAEGLAPARPPPARLVWKNKMARSGLGPCGYDTLAFSPDEMYVSVASRQMGTRKARPSLPPTPRTK